MEFLGINKKGISNFQLLLLQTEVRGYSFSKQCHPNFQLLLLVRLLKYLTFNFVSHNFAQARGSI